MRIFILWLITAVAYSTTRDGMTVIKESTKFAIPETENGRVRQTGFIRETHYARDVGGSEEALIIELQIQMESSGDWLNDTKVEHFVQFHDGIDPQVLLGGYCTDTYQKSSKRLLKGDGDGNKNLREAEARAYARAAKESCRSTSLSNADSTNLTNW